MASELSNLIAADLIPRTRKDAEQVADWLAGAASNLPLGDVIAANALFEAATNRRGLNIQVVAELRKRAPQRKTLHPVRNWQPSLKVSVVNMSVSENGAMVMEHNGKQTLVALEPGERDATYDDVHPYKILSHLAGHPLKVIGTSHEPAPRLDPDLLIGVGSAPIVLRSPSADPRANGVLLHNLRDELSIVCHKAGIVEPITWSFVRFFGREDEAMGDQFIEEALDTPEPALLARIDIALRQTAQSADSARAAWALRFVPIVWSRCLKRASRASSMIRTTDPQRRAEKLRSSVPPTVAF